MLEQLTIDQIAIIEHSEIHFRPGYNVLTGETGAGKSILIDALGLVLGERADASSIRHGQARATVSATFSELSSAHQQALAEDGLDDPDNPGQIHIRRTLRDGGGREAVRTIATTRYGYDVSETCDEIRRTNRFDETCQVTVPQSIVCFLESTDFEQAVRLAISIGGDSDTIAAMTGSLAEAFYGIPDAIARQALACLTQEMRDVVIPFIAQRPIQLIR